MVAHHAVNFKLFFIHNCMIFMRMMTPHNQRKNKQNSQNHAANHIKNCWCLVAAFLGGYNA